MRSTFPTFPFLLPAALLAGALALAGCGGGSSSDSSTATTAPLATAPLGTLGAKNLQLQVTTTGALLTLPCGQSAQITQPITLDAAGHFDVAGTLTQVQGAPSIVPTKPVPARFSGTTDGKTMTLTVTPPPLGAPEAAPYALAYGAPTVTDIGACPG